MIRLVQDASRRKICHVKLKLFAFYVARPRDDSHFPLHGLKQSRKRKTTLVADLLAFDMDDLGVDENVPLMPMSSFSRFCHT